MSTQIFSDGDRITIQIRRSKYNGLMGTVVRCAFGDWYEVEVDGYHSDDQHLMLNAKCNEMQKEVR